MHVVRTLTLVVVLAACVDTTLETPKNHPANPSFHAANPSKPPPALNEKFEPFAVYDEKAADASPSAARDHASEAHSSEQAPAPSATIYTCPMHPEIVRDAPGNCPICGMKLVPRKDAKPPP